MEEQRDACAGDVLAEARERHLHALSLLASSAAGQHLEVRDCGRGEASWTDRACLHLDLSLAPAQQRQCAVAQGLLIAAGSLTPVVARRLVGRPAVTRRYFACELRRALDQYGDALPLGIERALRAHIPTGVPAVEDGQGSLAAAFSPAPIAGAAALPPHLGRIRPARLAWSRAGLGSRAQVAQDDTAPRAEMERHDGDDDEIDRDASRWLRWLSTPLGGGELANVFAKLMGFGRDPASDDPNSADDGGGATALEHDAASAAAAARHTEPTEARALAPPRHPGRSEPAPARLVYPEWKGSAARYLPRHVHLHELWPGPASDTCSAATPGARIALGGVRRQLARVGVSLRRHRAQPDGDALDLDRVIRFGIERRRGAPPERLHLASRRSRRDLSLLVMLDASGSTADALPSGDTIFGQQRALAREVVLACARLGDRVALYGFHSWGRHNVRCIGIKGFAQPVGRAMEARLAGLEPAGLTRLGAAIRHGTHLLAADEGHSHRVMLLLSDGFAYDDEYREGHAEADTQRALQEAAEAGIACVCLNVGSQQDDETLRRLYGGAAYLRCADARRAVPALGRLMQGAIAAARAPAGVGRHGGHGRRGRGGPTGEA